MRTLATILLVAGTAFAAPVPKSLKKPASADGVWECVEFNSDGRSDDVPAQLRYRKVEGDQMSLGQETLAEVTRPMSELGPSTLRIDDPTQPALRTMLAGERKTFSAVLEVDGDTLRWAYTADRTLTECKPGLGVSYFLFQRVKDEK